MTSSSAPTRQTTNVKSEGATTDRFSNLKIKSDSLIDGRFSIRETRFGCWHSYSEDGTPLILSLTADACINGTRTYLYWHDKIDAGEYVDEGGYDSVVGGKL